ncbi:hypothetical protein ALC56_06264 [Trachymyrmex septentrionalis]|uniref:Uncharacterized protein n=1 Tax=Trachymyrmex septentrionalis TaxID=34720 RepID=A0A195FG19_9HYME|nr:hypothetical protein ALC56_06264 [Trachymyrmex septentrionalis]
MSPVQFPARFLPRLRKHIGPEPSSGRGKKRPYPPDEATVQACFATWKIVCKVDDEEDRSDFYPFSSSPSVLRPFHHVSRYVNGNRQLPNINGWPSPRGLSHTSIGPFYRTCISINSPACYNQTLNGRLDDRCLPQNFPRGKQCLRDDVGLPTARPTRRVFRIQNNVLAHLGERRKHLSSKTR